MACCKGPLAWWLWISGSVLVGVAAVAVALCWNTIINALLASVLVLTPSTETFNRWVAPDQPLVFEIYLFNWTNANHFPREKPKLEQLGPYRFREVRKHVNVTVFGHNATVAYRTQRSWFFDNATSNGSLADTITTLNMVAASAVFKKRYINYFLNLPLINHFIWTKYNQISVTKSVREMLFEGYDDMTLTLANILMPEPGLPDRFGWFYKRNNSIDTDEYMEVTSGAGGSPLGQILKWNHQDSLPYFNGSCSRLAGTAGEFITRGLENSSLTMFVPDLCRTVELEHVGSGQMEGLDYHTYELLERCFDKSSVSDENTCYCNGPCMWSGVMNVSSCRFGSPVFLSLPHFLYADPALREGVEGMAPDHEKHSFYFSVEPTLGVPLDVAARFQLNVYLEHSPYFAAFRNIPRMLFPVFWVQQHVTVTKKIFSELRVVTFVVKYGGLVFAVLALLCACLVLACCGRRPKYLNLGYCCPSSTRTPDVTNAQTVTLLSGTERKNDN